MGTFALEVKHITKEYKLYSSEIDRLKEAFSPFKREYHRKFYALNDVNFAIQKGEKVGIIGSNGAGKSTLLKIITEVLKPTEGEVIVDGRVAALLELGAGFNQDYTGIENIRLNGTLMGYSEEEIAEKMEKIIDFADIGEFIAQPVKTYSSGMFVRLAFATQIFSEPDILIVDEALSVGDIRFQQKCYRAMESLMKEKTVVLVTHDTAAVTRFCQRVIWINKGEKVYDGDAVEGLKQYQEFLINQSVEEEADKGVTSEAGNVVEACTASTDSRLLPIPEGVKSMGNGNAEITHCSLLDEHGNIVDVVQPGQQVDIAARIVFHKTADSPLFGVTIKDRLGNNIIALNSETLNIKLTAASGEREYHLKFVVPELNQGTYLVSVAIANGSQLEHVQYCWLDDVLVYKVPDRTYDVPGFLYLEHGQIDVYQND
jgi:ABC-type polysaccharide/polyol phosphate transport system ATPase subunit